MAEHEHEGAEHEGRSPAELLVHACADLRAIASALDPFSTTGLGIGVSDQRTASTAGPDRVPIVVGPQQLLPQNRSRRGLAIYHENPAASIVFLAFGTNASPQLYTLQLAGGQLYELQGPPFYIGELSMYAAAAGGALLLTELE